MGSVLWMEGLGLVRNIVQRYAVKMGSEQGFGVDEKVAHHCVDRPAIAASISPGGPGETYSEDATHWLAHFRYCVVS